MQALFCLVASAICLIAAAGCFRANQRYRGAIDTALGGERILWLVRLFSKGAEVTKPEGAVACVLTQTKLLTISLSLIGGLLFLVLGRIFAKAREG
jgi:hypothetical protein